MYLTDVGVIGRGYRTCFLREPTRVFALKRLLATMRSSRGSWAFHTSPMPPAPIRATSRYGPTAWPVAHCTHKIVSGGSRKNRLLGGARPAGCAVPPHAHNRVPAKLYQGRVDLIVTLGSIDATPASASLRAAREADGKSDLYFAGATVS
jgi:hypothetical protein